jgi:hypothetical protein
MTPPDFDDVTLEVDPVAGVIRLKAAASFGDPVELSPDAARELAQSLIQLADELD